MVAKWIEALTGPLEQKKQYRADKARIEGLPAPYAAAGAAMHRYLLNYGGIVDGDTLIVMFTDLADLWERAAADGVPVRDIVGSTPWEFAEEFAAAYGGTRWIDKERARLGKAMEDAEREQS